MKRSLQFALAVVLVGLLSAIAAPMARAQSSGCVSNPFGDRPLYLKGGFSSWNALPQYRFVYNCNRFELLLELSGTNDFKVADANWSADADFGGGTNGSRVSEGQPFTLHLHGSNLTYAFDGTQHIVIDVSQSSRTPTLTISQCPPNPLDDTPLFLRGSFNDNRPSSDYAFTYSCDAYYLNVNFQGTQEFKITDPDSTPATSFGAPDGAHRDVTFNQAFPLASDADAGGAAANLRFGFSGEHTLKVSFEGPDERPVLTIGPKTFVNLGAAPPVTDPVALSARYDSRDSTFKAPFGAAPARTKIDFALQAKPGIDAVTLVVEDRNLQGNQELLEYTNPRRLRMTRHPDGERERWTASYRFTNPEVYGYYFEIAIGDQRYVYQNNNASIYWTLERGSFGLGRIAVMPDNRAAIRRYRQTIYSADYTVPDWAKDVVYYYIFPERFRNGDTANDPRPGRDTYLNHGIEFHSNWLDRPWVPGDADGHLGDDDQYNNDFFGGDLAGIIDKLDYLKDLGINTLYINPLFEAASNHKYDTGDYLNIDDGFGTNAEFERLTREASVRGIRVILDTSLNHTGSDSTYFDRYAKHLGTGAFEGETIRPDSPWADWYTFNPAETDPDRKYNGWVGVTSLPELTESDSFKDFAFRNPNSVMNTWLDRGAAGWRMDVAPWVSDAFWREWRTYVKAHQPDALTVAETWFDSSKYFLGDQFDSTMNYIFRNTLLDYAGGRDADAVYPNIELMREAYPPQAFYALMNLLSTHDAARTLYEFGYTGPDTAPEKIAEAKQRLRLAVLFQMTFPGSPTIFYGDEVGLTGGQDPFNRATYPWADKGGHPDNNLLTDFKGLIKLRNDQAVLRRGSIDAPLHIDHHLVVLDREYRGVWALTAYNNDTTAHDVTVDLPRGARNVVFKDAFTGRRVTPVDGKLSITVPPLFGSVLITESAVATPVQLTPPPATPATPATPAAGPDRRVAIRRATLRVDRKRRVKVAIRCGPTRANRCRGILQLLWRGKVLLARRSFSVPIGAYRSVTLKLNPSAYRTLKQSKRLRVSVILLTRGSDGQLRRAETRRVPMVRAR